MAGYMNNTGNQNSTMVRSSSSYSIANAKICPQKSTNTVNRGKHPVQNNLRTDQKINITDEPTYRRDASSICTSKLANEVLENASMFETQRLIHVVSWTELFLDKHHTSDSMQEFAQPIVRSTLDQNTQKKVTQDIRDTQPEDFDLELLNTHASNGLNPKNILEQTEKGTPALLNHNTLTTSLDEMPIAPLRPTKIYSKRELLSACTLPQTHLNLSFLDELCPIQTIKYEQEHQEERGAIVGGKCSMVVHKDNNRKKARFQNSYTVCKGDYSISAAIDQHESFDSYFWTPLSESSDEECANVVMTKKDTLTKTRINAPSSTRFLKPDHMKHASISVLEEGLPSTISAKSFENGNLTAENLAEIKENDTFKDFMQTLKSDNSRDNAKSTAEQVRNRNNPFDPEAQKDELSFLDFQSQKKGSVQKKETKSVHMAVTDKSFEGKKCIEKQQTDNLSNGENCTGGQTELELQPPKKNPSKLISSLCKNVLLKPLGNTTCEVSSGTFDLHYTDNDGCAEGDSVTQSPVPKYVQGDINEYGSGDIIKSTENPKSSSGEFLIQKIKVDHSKKLFSYNKVLSDSYNEDSVLAQYYFYLDYLGQSQILQPEETNHSFSCEELHGISQEEKLAAHCHFQSSSRMRGADTENADSDFGLCGKNCSKEKRADMKPPEEQESKDLFMDVSSRPLSHLPLTEQRGLGNLHRSKDEVIYEIKKIGTNVADPKRQWERPSIARSSCSHGELKPRSQHVRRPASADENRRKGSNKSWSLLFSGEKNRQQHEIAFQGDEERNVPHLVAILPCRFCNLRKNVGNPDVRCLCNRFINARRKLTYL
ncbi:uncharacterized protein LOC143841046 [Paroedura picta]|uniref:uncharacterized protein LOC143841046 n=1 Tax=Paroedura picta TaxID=143630 RepID=UPI004057B51C